VTDTNDHVLRNRSAWDLWAAVAPFLDAPALP